MKGLVVPYLDRKLFDGELYAALANNNDVADLRRNRRVLRSLAGMTLLLSAGAAAYAVRDEKTEVETTIDNPVLEATAAMVELELNSPLYIGAGLMLMLSADAALGARLATRRLEEIV